MLIAAALVAVLVALLVRGLLADESLPDRVEITEVPLAYRVTYEVVQAAGPDRAATETREILQVERPFRSLVTTTTPDGEPLGGRIADLNRLLQFTDGRWTEMQVPPAMASSDLRLDVDGVLDDAHRRDDVRRIAGRACQVYRFGGPISAGTLPAPDPDVDEHADVCIDEAGLVLLEEWRKDGELLRRRTALDVDVDPDFAADTFTVEDSDELSAPDGGGSATRVDDDEPFGDRTWTLAAPPDGFEHVGRWAVVWPRLSTAVDPFSDPIEGRVAGIATVWTDGADAIVIEQGGTGGGGDTAFQPHPDGERVDLGDLDIGEVITDARGTEVRVAYTDGTFVRVWSTLSRDVVLELARGLEAR